MKVLVIDDDEIARELLCSELQEAGFDVSSLPSPIGATRVIQEKDVDAVVVDVVMPALRGDRLAALLRHNPRFANLAVILVSGDESVVLQQLASAVDADGIVSKKRIRGVIGPTVHAALRARAPKSAKIRMSATSPAAALKKR
jgi:PleD family two-component response regulator